MQITCHEFVMNLITGRLNDGPVDMKIENNWLTLNNKSEILPASVFNSTPHDRKKGNVMWHWWETSRPNEKELSKSS